MKKRAPRKKKARSLPPAIVLTYVGSLLLFLLAAFYPDHHLWAVTWWAYYPPPVALGLFFAGLAVLYAAYRWHAKGEAGELSGHGFLIASAVSLLVFGILFWLMRGHTHFLGDGYQLLSRLSSDNPIIKPWNFGGIAIPIWLSSLLGERSEAGVRFSYQIISVFAGLSCFVVTFIAARRLFTDNVDRLLFVLGVMTGGTSLLFFGYVENYALFVVTVFCFGLIGLLVSRGEVSRWWVLPALALCLFFHIFGAALIPAGLYILVSNTKLGDWISAQSMKLTIPACVAIVLLLVTAFWNLYTTHYFLRFSLVPLIADEFTVEGYTLLSAQHVMDWLSLWVLWLPGIFVLVPLFLRRSGRRAFSQRDHRFLLILLICCACAVFVLDPRLGMPRDWDLFSFAGVPLIILAYFALLETSGSNKGRRTTAILLIVLALLSLLPRAYALTDKEMSWDHLRNYLAHDNAKNVAIRSVWLYQLETSEDTVLARTELERARKDCPETGLEHYAWELFRGGQVRSAMEAFRRVVQMNPMRSKSWAAIGRCFIELNEPDSALRYLRISDGLSPYRPYVYCQLGYAYFGLGEYDLARDYWQRVRETDPEYLSALVGLTTMYTTLGDIDRYDETFLLLAAREDTPVKFFADQVVECLNRGLPEHAYRAFKLAVKRGPQSAEVQGLLQDVPELSKWLE
ncbi:MAG: tetratricopeptide repeat protein [bacterium]|nr:tetratricopeptide repeat protein [bacterium]